jgi:hypothetical protein
LQFKSLDVPIEILAFDLDIGHAIANLALPHLPGGFFLTGTHLKFSAQCAVVMVGERKFEISRSKILKKVREVGVACEVAWSMLTLEKCPKLSLQRHH